MNLQLGIKRTCLSCQTRFYDLAKDPIECPKCHWRIAADEFMKQGRSPPKKKDRDLELTPAEITNESLIEYEINEDEFGEDLLIEDDKDTEEADNEL